MREGVKIMRMMSIMRFFAVALSLALASLAVTGSMALAQVAPAPDKKGEWIHPPAELPKAPRGDRNYNLDMLFGGLKVAPDDASAKAIENRIWALMLASKSDTANLLMTRVKTAVDGENLDLAIQLLDSIIEIKPDYIEAWNRRATLYFLKKDYGRAFGDITEVLSREPRHFGALSGLGLIMQEMGDDKTALKVYRRALEVHPRLQRIPDIVKTLTEKVEGRPI
ncbi:MAG: repeat-containing protein [Xanthobacteraceae bacterium]|nr:repeat-containing protein [Xanthobacteraceae bacterium]